jgi:hypothetical protein
MSKQRDSVKRAVESQQGEACWEELAGDVAYKAGAQIVIRGLDAFILINGAEEHLCTADVPKRLWWNICCAMGDRFPTLGRIY